MSRPQSLETVYPRWRGEHYAVSRGVPVVVGLSPLARGTRVHWPDRCALSRFIPAGAGNTGMASSSSRIAAVYPRWRGEHGGLLVSASATRGLSPLARGTQDERHLVVSDARFIPAGAGNTRNSLPVTRPFCGLSPLARGTRDVLFPVCAFPRFIPAGAGNTPALQSSSSCAAVYPRWRGEHQRYKRSTG